VATRLFWYAILRKAEGKLWPHRSGGIRIAASASTAYRARCSGARRSCAGRGTHGSRATQSACSIRSCGARRVNGTGSSTYRGGTGRKHTTRWRNRRARLAGYANPRRSNATRGARSTSRSGRTWYGSLGKSCAAEAKAQQGRQEQFGGFHNRGERKKEGYGPTARGESGRTLYE